jgi:hypothetical protein
MAAIRPETLRTRLSIFQRLACPPYPPVEDEQYNRQPDYVAEHQQHDRGDGSGCSRIKQHPTKRNGDVQENQQAKNYRPFFEDVGSALSHVHQRYPFDHLKDTRSGQAPQLRGKMN